MSLASPAWLLALLAVPLLIAAYLAAQKRRRRFALRYPAAPVLLAAARSAGPDWRRYLPLGLASLAIAALAVAASKPQHDIQVAAQQASVVLVTDHSGSMQATDVEPTRLDAAQRAGNVFVDAVPKQTKVGIVAFSETADAVQDPTTDHKQVKRIINSLFPDGATATGDALAVALSLVRQGNKKPPAAIVLLSDGARTVGQDPVAVARIARQQHVPVYTVALGTEDATVPNPDPFGPPLSAAPDPLTLKQIAQASGGTAFAAGDAQRLSSIYERLGSQIGSKTKKSEFSWVFVLIGIAGLLGAAVFTLQRAARLP